MLTISAKVSISALFRVPRRTKYLKRSREFSPSSKDIHQRLGIAKIKPVPAWRDNHEDVAHLKVGFVLVLELPTPPVVSGEVPRAKRKFFKHGHGKLLIYQHPERIFVTYRNNDKRDSDSTGNAVVHKQMITTVDCPGQGEEEKRPNHLIECHTGKRWLCRRYAVLLQELVR